MSDKLVLFGAGQKGIEALKSISIDHISFFIDNDSEKSGKKINGLSIYAFEDIKDKISDNLIIITAKESGAKEIKNQLDKHGILNYIFLEDYLRKTLPERTEIKKYKNLYQGRKCFLIGSGSSLKIEDLEMISKAGEICFACNKIFKLFDKTTWKPDIYCVGDERIYNYYKNEISSLKIEKMLAPYLEGEEYGEALKQYKTNDSISFYNQIPSRSKENIEFSEDLSKYLIRGVTVMYSMIQIARYMGFTEMYLLGVDFSYSDMSGRDSKNKDHFCDNYIEKNEVVQMSSQERVLEYFEAAEKFSYQYGFRIFNATRGGKLEVFERVLLEDVLNEK